MILQEVCAEPCRFKSGVSLDLRQDYTFIAVSDLYLRGSCNPSRRFANSAQAVSDLYLRGSCNAYADSTKPPNAVSDLYLRGSCNNSNDPAPIFKL